MRKYTKKSTYWAQPLKEVVAGVVAQGIGKLDFTTPTDLCEIMGRNGSDKGNVDLSKTGHNFTILYDQLFRHVKDKEVRLFELGLGTDNPNLLSNMCGQPFPRPGASLHGWKEYFPRGKIFGADIDGSILFEEDNIKTYFCDQLNNETIQNMWNLNAELNEEFDIILEDGLHTVESSVNFFQNSFHKLKENGVYIIEDVYHDLGEFSEFISSCHAQNLNINFIQCPKDTPSDNQLSQAANNILVITKK